MMNADTLVIPASTPSGSALVAAGGLALPATVETAAWAAAGPDGLGLLINNPGLGETKQWRVLPTHALEPMPSLPLVAAGAIWCGKELVVTGADAKGRPLAVGVTADGQVTWQVMIEGPAPMRWPVPGCISHPVVVWQAAHGRLETADLGPEGVRNHCTISVGGPPLEIAIGAEAIWVVWAAPSGIEGLEIRGQQMQAIHVPAHYPGSVSVAAGPAGACLAWIQGNEAFFAAIGPAGKPGAPAIVLDLPQASMCQPAVIPGPQPLVWARYAETNEGEEFRWSSAFIFPGERPLLIEGLVHQVAWWGERLVLVGTREMRFLKISGR